MMRMCSGKEINMCPPKSYKKQNESDTFREETNEAHKSRDTITESVDISQTWGHFLTSLEYRPYSTIPPNIISLVPSQMKPYAAQPGGTSPLTAGTNH